MERMPQFEVSQPRMARGVGESRCVLRGEGHRQDGLGAPGRAYRTHVMATHMKTQAIPME